MAKTGKLKCSKCDRSFKMAAHLGRHMSTIHAAKGKAKRAGRKAAKRAVKRMGRRSPVGRPPGGVVGQLWRCRRQLLDSREALSARIAAMDDALAALGG